MNESELMRFDVLDERHGAVPCAAVLPRGAEGALPLCLFLYGGTGSRETLAEIHSVLDAWWVAGAIPRMLVATPDVGPFSFYLDDPERGLFWESFVTGRFVTDLRERFRLRARAALVGISMGGYGALKVAFSRSAEFAAVAAISPMLEPAFPANSVPLRNRYHYPPEVPQALLGPVRDAALYERDHPATRARIHAAAVRDTDLAIYLDASGRDTFHAHDGAEHLHRLLWSLDIPHEYLLRRDFDHAGPELVDRLREAFAWVGARLQPAAAPTPSALRAQFAGLRAEATASDPSFERCYGRLP
ncbi:MAG TPA: alpha/beta hydrolase-fold protein [Polyangiales bacterium]|nr:alpha/beta hydrolase-fold protein [Polyangiales bacterium]